MIEKAPLIDVDHHERPTETPNVTANIHTAIGGMNNLQVAENTPPPSYADVRPAVASMAPDMRLLLGLNTRLLNLDFQQYNLPQSVTSDDQTTVITTHPMYSSDVQALIKLLQHQAALPPKPVVRIRGTHSEYGTSYGPDKIDFDLMLNIMPLILRAESERWNYLKVDSTSHPAARSESNDEKKEDVFSSKDGDVGLEEWARRFCDDEAEAKCFTLERNVINWDTEYLSGQIRNIIASSKYVGTLTITFPILHSKVIVLQTSHSSTSTGSSKKWINKLFSGSASSTSPPRKNPTLPQRQYTMIQSVWPYATSPTIGAGSSLRECAAQSEQAWWQVWKTPIHNAVLAKKRGWVTAEDWIETTMGLAATEREKEWGKGANDW